MLELAGKHYCVYVDVYSDYIEVCDLEDLTTETLVKKSKVFVTHGIPVTLFSDNGPNYASKDFAIFARTWDFEHLTSSPHHSKSNGRAEAAVKTVKNIMKKAQDGDIWMSILEWRNTVTPGADSSPAQRLMSRRTRSFLPCHPDRYNPEVQAGLQERVITNRRQAKMYHDRGSKELPDLVIGQPIRAKGSPQKEGSPWLPGRVMEKVAPRSYLVEVNGRKYRRNRIHLRDTALPGTAYQVPRVADDVPDIENNTGTQTTPTAPPVTKMPSPVKNKPTAPDKPQATTRVGRVSRPPAKYKDYVQ